MPEALSVQTDLIERRERKAEMAALDALPAEVRCAITAAQVKIPVRICADMIAKGETIEFVVDAIRRVDQVKCFEYRQMMASGAFMRPNQEGNAP
jgi:hypothetical protein